MHVHYSPNHAFSCTVAPSPQSQFLLVGLRPSHKMLRRRWFCTPLQFCVCVCVCEELQASWKSFMHPPYSVTQRWIKCFDNEPVCGKNQSQLQDCNYSFSEKNQWALLSYCPHSRSEPSKSWHYNSSHNKYNLHSWHWDTLLWSVILPLTAYNVLFWDQTINSLPCRLTCCTYNKAPLKAALRRYLNIYSMYSVDEFLMFKNCSQADYHLYIMNLV